MVEICIPVKLHVKQYLIKRYGLKHKITKKTFLGIVLLNIIDKGDYKQASSKEKTVNYIINVPEFYFNTKGFNITPEKLNFLSNCLDRLFMEDFYRFVDIELLKPNSNAYQSVALFLKFYEIQESHIKLESMYRNYQRYCDENIKQKKNKIPNQYQ